MVVQVHLVSVVQERVTEKEGGWQLPLASRTQGSWRCVPAWVLSLLLLYLLLLLLSSLRKGSATKMEWWGLGLEGS